MKKLYIVQLYNFRGNFKTRVLITAENEESASHNAKESYGEFDTVDFSEFVCMTPDDVSKAV